MITKDVPLLNQSYADRVLGRFRANCIRYFPLDDASSARARELVKGDHGTRTGTTLGQPGINGPSSYFDSINDFVNIYSAALNTDFAYDPFTVSIWVHTDAAAWVDNVERSIIEITADVNNTLALRKHGNNFLYVDTSAGGVRTFQFAVPKPTDWFHCAIAITPTSWQWFLDTIPQLPQVTGIWVGALAANACCIGSADTTPNKCWLGHLAHCSLYNRALSADEITWIWKEAYV